MTESPSQEQNTAYGWHESRKFGGEGLRFYIASIFPYLYCHCAMLKNLGASMDPDQLDPSFPHPLQNGKRVHVLLDVCHMLKLARNTLGSCSVIINPTGDKIMWQHIKELSHLQQNEGLHLGNKLRQAHISWQTQKMKVNLAAQTFSSSVADAMEFCKTKLMLPSFQDCTPTCEFIRIFDKLFDVLNSRNPLAKDFKAPLRQNNFQLHGSGILLYSCSFWSVRKAVD